MDAKIQHFLLAPLILSFLLPAIVCYSDSAVEARIGFVPLSLRRTKRGEHELLDFGSPAGGSTFPPDYEIEDDNKETKGPETTEHNYYNMTTYTNNTEVFQRHYVDVDKWIHQGGAKGQTENTHLDDAYRKAAGVRLNFEFPFYGHKLQNLTIATGGFLYVGDQTHSWLAATQYIAPLMANFDTMDNKSKIQYGDDGKRMIVEWKEVTLRDNRQVGPFTFQAHLWRNGNITFVYKQVPIPVGNISDAQHPCKLGISDAYLFNHKVSTALSQSPTQSKRVIHEYHRITINNDKIGPNSVVLLTALPTCLDATTCDECTKMQLKAFKCSWCSPKETGKEQSETGTDGGKPFCSDQLGLHRRRQEWIEGNCQMQDDHQYCKIEEMSLSNTTSTATPEPALISKDTTLVTQIQSTTSKPAQSKEGIAAPQSVDEGSSGIAFVTLFMLVAISSAVWVAYAYFNPHTRSGQWLIKYRPSKWQIPSSHVRYSASVHM